MANNNSYFFISGFISISLFIFFFSLIFLMMFSSSKVDIYALKIDNYISISITTPKLETRTEKKNISQPIVEESASESQDVNIDELFSDVWTKSIKKQTKKSKIDTKRFQEIAKKSKKIDKKNQKKVEKNSSNAREVSETSQKQSTGTVVNEYMAKITGLVYQAFHPTTEMEGNIVVAVLEISAMGKVTDFRILTYSASESLNNECEKIRKRLVGKLFPMHPDKKSSTIIVNIIPENKGNI